MEIKNLDELLQLVDKLRERGEPRRYASKHPNACPECGTFLVKFGPGKMRTCCSCGTTWIHRPLRLPPKS